MLKCVADTHAVVWYLFDDGRLSVTAASFLDGILAGGNEVGISSITIVEIVYLAEKGRLGIEVLPRIEGALDDPIGGLTEIPVDRRVAAHLSRVGRDAVPDMPDRIIAATAAASSVPIVSRDGHIRASGIETVW